MKHPSFGVIFSKLQSGSKQFKTRYKNIHCSQIKAALCLSFCFYVLPQSAWAFQRECRISGNKGESKNVLSGDYPQTVKSKIDSGTIVYVGWDSWNGSQIFQIKDGAFEQIGMIKTDDLDCSSIGPSDGYPILFDNVSQLYEASGLVFDDVDEAEKHKDNLHSCLYIGDGSAGIWLSKQFLSKYDRKKSPIDTICTVLKSGQVRFDPETGVRMPTYIVRNSGRAEEYTLVVPDCFSKGRFVRNSLNSAIISPIGCTVNYHPYSGRKLSPDETSIFTKLTDIVIDGGAGEVKEDSANLLSTSTRRGNSVDVDSLRNMLK